MKKFNFLFIVAFFATVLITSCANECDKNDITSECYEPPTIIKVEPIVINGVSWAPFNVGSPNTFVNASETSGMYYQWNRKIGWNSNLKNEWDFTIPTGTKWTAEYDPCPQDWHVPAIEEIKTLLDSTKVTNEWTTQNNINGRRFTDKISGNHLFLPAVGMLFYTNGVLTGDQTYSYYWSSTQYNETDKEIARTLNFNSSDVSATGSIDRRFGLPVRCVTE